MDCRMFSSFKLKRNFENLLRIYSLADCLQIATITWEKVSVAD